METATQVKYSLCSAQQKDRQQVLASFDRDLTKAANPGTAEIDSSTEIDSPTEMAVLKSTVTDIQEMDLRLTKIREELVSEGVDLLIVSSMENIYYLSHYQTVGGCIQCLIVTQHNIHIFTRELEVTNAYYRSHVPASFYDESQKPVDSIVKYIREHYRFTVVGLEYDSSRLTYSQTKELEAGLKGESADVSFKDCSTLVSRFRMIKSTDEVSKVRKAAGFVAAGLQAAVNEVKVGMMETALGGIITGAMCRLGCEYPAYPVFLCSGETGCLGHYTPTQKLLQDNEVLFMEVGGCYARYHAARMHAVYLGSRVPDWFTKAEQLIREAVRVGKEQLKPGAVAGDVDRKMRDVIAAYPYTYKQSERSGYSIGIGFYTDWSEPMFYMHPGSEARVEEGMTIHLIPWIQVPNKGAIGFSDTVLVTEEGAVSLFENDVYQKESSLIFQSP